MTIVDFKDWLKTEIDAPNWFAGGMRSAKGQMVVIYNGTAYTNPVAIGGIKNSSYRGKGVRVLVHWNKNIKDTEQKANEIYEFLQLKTDFYINSTRVIQINMRDPEPVFLGVDDNGTYEYVIDLELIIER